MRLMIPPLGTSLELKENWDFFLYPERRNLKLIKALRNKFEFLNELFGTREYTSAFHPFKKVKYEYLNDSKIINGVRIPLKAKVFFPAGTILKVSRIYIRQGQKGFDSVTFNIAKHPDKIKARFWVKLEDCNRIECEIVD